MYKTITLCSWGQLEGEYSNLGDKLIFDTQINIIRSHLPDADFFAFSQDPLYTERKYNLRATNPFSLKGFIKFIQYIKFSDLVIVGGGELIQDKSSKAYLIFNLLPIWLAKFFKKDCVAIGIGISREEELSSFGKKLASASLKKLDACTVRDHASYERALSLGLPANKLILSSDIVFSPFLINETEATEELSLFSGKKYLVISLRDITGRKGGLLPASLKRKFSRTTPQDNPDVMTFVNTISDAINHIHSVWNYHVVLWPSYIGKNFSSRDDHLHELIEENVENPEKIYKISRPLTTRQVLSLLQKAELLIGTPLHTLITATIAHCPFIAINYADKGSKYMQQLGYPDEYIMNLKNSEETKSFNKDKLIDKIEKIIHNRESAKKHLEEKHLALIEKCKANEEVLKKFITKGNYV